MTSSVIPHFHRNSDCVHCIKRKKTCDRARPRCTACARANLDCARSTARFTWKPGFSLTRKPFRKRKTAWSCSRKPKNSCTFILEDPSTVLANRNSDNTAIVWAERPTFCPEPVIQRGQDAEQECWITTIPGLNLATCSYPTPSVSAIPLLETTLSWPVQFSALAERYQPILEQCKS